MRKDALTITVSTIVMGVFGAFLRWLQLNNIFEDTGLAVPGSGFSIVYVVFMLLVLAGMIGIVQFRLKRLDAPRDGEAALHTETVYPTVAGWIGCAIFVAAGLVLMFTAGEVTGATARWTAVKQWIQRLFGAGAIIAGVCLPALPCRHVYENVSIIGRKAAAFILPLFYCYWLVFTYINNTEDPVLWNYVPEILAVAGNTVAFYYIGAWIYGWWRRDAAMVAIQYAVFLDICTLPDSRHGALLALFIVSAAMLLMLEYILIRNMTETPAAVE